MLHRLRDRLAKPVSWGAVALTYIGIIAAVAYAASVGATNASGLRAESRRADAALTHEATRSRRAIVQSGRVAIKSACVFDNQRSRELRAILRGSIDPSDSPQDKARIHTFIETISFRDCDAAAAVLTANPEETP